MTYKNKEGCGIQDEMVWGNRRTGKGSSTAARGYGD